MLGDYSFTIVSFASCLLYCVIFQSLKNKVKEEKDARDEAEEELNKMKKKVKDARKDIEEAVAAKEEVC